MEIRASPLYDSRPAPKRPPVDTWMTSSFERLSRVPRSTVVNVRMEDISDPDRDQACVSWLEILSDELIFQPLPRLFVEFGHFVDAFTPLMCDF